MTVRYVGVPLRVVRWNVVVGVETIDPSLVRTWERCLYIYTGGVFLAGDDYHCLWDQNF